MKFDQIPLFIFCPKLLCFSSFIMFDQSIYKFRGANVKNILNFENVFPEAVTIKLEQNYRSTKNILNAANEVIKHNKGRKAKKLWTENEEGDLIAIFL